jgi:branched-chain amino acid transport system substrate-binding protein
MFGVRAIAIFAAGAITSAAADDILKLGSILAVSGPNASIGKESLGGIQFAVDNRNKAGGVKIGDKTYKLVLDNIDDQSLAERSVAGAQKLISEDNVPVIFTPASSTTTLAVIPIAEKNKRIAMSFVAAAPAVVSPEYKYSFRTTLSATMNVAPSVEYLIKNKGAKTIAYLGRNDDWGRAAGKAIADKAAELGAKVVVNEYFDTGSVDFYGLLTEVRAAKPDAVVAAAFTEDGVPMIKQFRELEMTQPFLSVAVIWASPTFIRAAGDTLNGVYISTGPTTTQSPELDAFKADFLKETGGPALPFGITGYDNVNLIIAAMQKAGATDPEKIADTLRNFEFKGLLQTYKFDNSNQSQVVINVNQFDGEKTKVISSLVTH